MTKALRQVQMKEAEVLLEAAQMCKRKNEMEVEILSERKKTEESDRKKARFEEARAEMLFLLTKREYMSKFGVEYQLKDVMNSCFFSVLRICFILIYLRQKIRVYTIY